MSGLLAWVSVESETSPVEWATFCGAFMAVGVGLLLLPNTRTWLRGAGLVCGVAGLTLLLIRLPRFQEQAIQLVFGVLAVITVLSSAATITSRRPLYAALWFALSLVGVASLFLLQGAQFLGVATIAVYAGAVVVMFLFVVMLANPEGNASYDQQSWGRFVPLLAVTTGLLLSGLISWSVLLIDPLERTAAGPLPVEAHMASFGAALFGKRLISVEVTGTLLLVALVAAVAIMVHGKQMQEGSRHDE
ncbi:MAG: NADH-quinone oxidoreductase subunit J [Planctomycetota bacterium]|nr:NADH-quinone oxidoreductase subunit J [Planctomycetota bacterium]